MAAQLSIAHCCLRQQFSIMFESGLEPGEPMTGGCALEPLADDHTPEDGTNHVDRALGSFTLNGPVISPVKQPCQKKAIMAASSFTKRIT